MQFLQKRIILVHIRLNKTLTDQPVRNLGTGMRDKMI